MSRYRSPATESSVTESPATESPAIGQKLAHGLHAPTWRWLWLALILMAFARLCWRLDVNNMWWDESLSLQRAEADWATLIRGTLSMYDGFNVLHTTDQHPFFSFLIQGILMRLAGNSEFVLRYPAALAATLLVPVVGVLARYFVRSAVLPPTTAWWAMGFAALHPFYLWFGQEARPYALWSTLSLLALYLLLRATETTLKPGWLVGYGLVTLLSLATHYYAIFWLPLHALQFYGWLAKRSRWLGATIALALLLLGGLVGSYLAWQVLRQGGGGNFPEITLDILIPDLVNAFSLGLTVTLDDLVHWLGWLFGGLALVGGAWSMRSRQSIGAGGWLLPLSLLVPVVIILLVSFYQSAYMNARHLSLLGGSIIVLVGGGLALFWKFQRWPTALLALLLSVGLGYSTVNYFTQPAYGKDDYSAMGRYLEKNLLPHDVLLISPPFSWRIFHYYLPVQSIEMARERGLPVAHYGVPLLNQPWPANERFFRELQQKYRRIWLARSGTHPSLDPEGKVADWLRNNSTMRLTEEKFFSPTSFLDLELFLTQPPIYAGMDPPAQQPIEVVYGDLIRLAGYDVEAPIRTGGPIPITLYWQVHEKPAVRYKYILQLLRDEGGSADSASGMAETAMAETVMAQTVIAQTEIEPYNGQIPTTVWDPDKTIVEYTALPPVALDPEQAANYRLALQLYAAESLEKLAVTTAAAPVTVIDGQQAQLPFPLPK